MTAIESSLARLALTISRKLAFTFSLALCASVFTLSAFAQKVKIITFDPPGSVQTMPMSINAAGAITGSYSDGTTTHGFLRMPDSTFTTFDAPGAMGTLPFSINAAGAIAGYYLPAPPLTASCAQRTAALPPSILSPRITPTSTASMTTARSPAFTLRPQSLMVSFALLTERSPLSIPRHPLEPSPAPSTIQARSQGAISIPAIRVAASCAFRTAHSPPSPSPRVRTRSPLP